MKVKRNFDKDDLYCIGCKERIYIGEKYIEIEEIYFGEIIVKPHHPECLPEQEDE